MKTFRELLKQIRKESCLTQEELADTLGFSTVFIAMIETGQKKPSKNFINRLAEEMKVNHTSLTPFVMAEDLKAGNLNLFEKELVVIGEKLQTYLIKNKSKNLRNKKNGS